MHAKHRHHATSTAVVRRTGVLLAAASIALTLAVSGARNATAADPVTLQVATTGSDVENCGSQLAPCRTVQTAIDAAAAGDTINIAAGTYTEQVSIDKDLTLTGAGAGATTIQSPASLATSFTVSNTARKAVVAVTGGANIAISGLTVDGDGQGNANYSFVGIGIHNASASVDSVTVTGVSNTPLSGVQSGVALYAYNDDSSARTVTVQNSTVTGYQKGGLVLSGANLTAVVRNNAVTGAGQSNLIAQNGIQISYGASGTVADNTVTGNYCTVTNSGDDCTADVNGTDTHADGAAGILLYAAGNVTVENNTMSDNQYGVWSVGSTVLEVTGNTLHDAIAPDTSSAGIVVANADQWTSSLSQTPTATQAALTGNTLTGMHYGLVVQQYGGTPSNSAPVVSAHRNTITGTVAAAANVPVDATSNWWGSGEPDFGTLVVGSVAHSPWYIDADMTTLGYATTWTVSPDTTGACDTDDATCTTIMAAIDAAAPGDLIEVSAGVYDEAVTISKPDLTISGAGAATTTIAPSAANATSLTFASSGAIVSGVTVTHEYSDDAKSTWDFNNNGVTFSQGATVTNNALTDSIVTLNRNGVYFNTSSGNTVQNSTITNNRTGINITSGVGATIAGNTITDNWTMGVVIYPAVGRSVDLDDLMLSGNTMAGNWYGEVLVKSNGTNANVSGTLDLSNGNTFGDEPVVYTTNTATALDEPAFSDQHPEALGGDASAPAGGPLYAIRVSGLPDAAVTYPGKTILVDNNTETAPAAAYSSIQAGIDAASAGDSVLISPGTYPLSAPVLVGKAVTIAAVDGSGDVIVQAAAGKNAFTITAVTSDSGSGGERVTLRGMTVTATGSGSLIASGVGWGTPPESGHLAPLSLDDVDISSFNYGLNINNDGTRAASVAVKASTFHGNNLGIKISTTSAVGSLNIEGSHFDDNVNQGLDSEGEFQRAGSLGELTIKNSTFNGNGQKGIYVTALGTAVLDGVTVNGSGTSEGYNWGAGIDLNLYNSQTSSITIKNSTVSKSGIRPANAPGNSSGPSISIAARADKGDPAATIADVVIQNNTLKEGQVGISLSGSITNAEVRGNSFAGFTGTALVNSSAAAVDADHNYWGSSTPKFADLISTTAQGPVSFVPWYTDAAMTKTTSQLPAADKPQVTVSTSDAAVQVTDSNIDYSGLTRDSSGGFTVPETIISATTGSGSVAVNIAASTKITPVGAAAAGWNGVVAAPAVVTPPPSSMPSNSAAAFAISVGSPDVSLSFDKPVRLLLPGQAGKNTGFIDNVGRFTAITITCSADDQTDVASQLDPGQACAMTVGTDLAVWTTHFTTFVTYSVRAGGGAVSGIGDASGLPGAPAAANRIAGADRYATAAAIAAQFGPADAVIVANGTDAKQGADALAANYLAGQVDAPILLTGADRVSAQTIAAVESTLADSAHPVVYIMGGTDSVSASVVAAISSAAKTAATGEVRIVRIAGADRYSTSAAVAAAGKAAGSVRLASGKPAKVTAILASGQVNADALAAGPIANAWHLPVLLTTRDQLPESVAQEIRRGAITQLLVLGGTDRVSQAVLDQAAAAGATTVQRIAGTDRFATAADLYTRVGGTMTDVSGSHYGADAAGTVYLANGLTGFPDALSVGPLAGKTGAVLLTASADALDPAARSFVSDHAERLDRITALGQPTTLSAAVLATAAGEL